VTVPRKNTRAQQKANKALLAASDVCWLCGHPGADAVEHKIPLATATTPQEYAHLDQGWNKAPAHHTLACPTCGIKCNRVKSDKLIAPVARRSGSLVR
jgi:5-methylcytosine-specific restriction endonuclease McrA